MVVRDGAMGDMVSKNSVMRDVRGVNRKRRDMVSKNGILRDVRGENGVR